MYYCYDYIVTTIFQQAQSKEEKKKKFMMASENSGTRRSRFLMEKFSTTSFQKSHTINIIGVTLL